MKRFILAFSMFSVWLAIASTYYTCVIKGICDNTETVNTTPITTKTTPIIKEEVVLNNANNVASAEKTSDSLAITENEIGTIDTLKITGLRIYDNNSLLKAYYSNFKIYQNSTNVRIPIGISEYGYVIAKHMDSLDSALIIKGYYNQEETPDKGLQRAIFIKERLIKLGIPTALITTTTLQGIFKYSYNKFTGGILFDFKKTDSIFRLNRVDYTLFKNSQNNVETIIELDTASKEESATQSEEIKISDMDMEAITKKEATPIVPSAEAKKEKIPVVKKEKIRFTVTGKDFKNNKFKASKTFKKFIETHETAKSILLFGYSNASKNSTTNYTKGLELANLVRSYIIDKGIYSGKTTTNASKNETLAGNDAINEGVTLIIQ